MERPICYIRDSFFYERAGANDEDLNEQVSRWLEGALLHESELARTDPDPQFLHRPMRYDIGLPSPVI